MDSRLKKAMEAEAAQKTAEALVSIVPQLASIEARLDRIEALLAQTPATDQPRDNTRKGGR